MTPFRRWIESKCIYSTQWGACNVSSSARPASDLGVLLNLSPVSSRRCVAVPSFFSFYFSLFCSPSPFFCEPGEETRSRTLVAVWCRHRARYHRLTRLQPPQHMHQPAALPVAAPALSSCENPPDVCDNVILFMFFLC